MKFSLVSIALSLISSAALACPNLAGTYTCEGDPAEGISDSTVTVTQSENAGVTTYDVSSVDSEGTENFSLLADGVTRTESEDLTDDQGNVIGSVVVNTTVTCLSDVLNTNVSYLATIDGYGEMSGKAVIDASKTAAGLVTDSTFEATGPDGSVEKEVSHDVCAAVAKR